MEEEVAKQRPRSGTLLFGFFLIICDFYFKKVIPWSWMSRTLQTFFCLEEPAVCSM